MKHIFTGIMLIVGLALIQGSALGQKSVDKKDRPSLCEIISHPDKYVGKEIKFFFVFCSGLWVTDLLSDPDCKDRLIEPSFRDKAFRDKIYKKSKKDGDGISKSGRFLFTGTLKKNPGDGGLPIRGLLQGYTMKLKSFSVP